MAVIFFVFLNLQSFVAVESPTVGSLLTDVDSAVDIKVDIDQ